MTDSAASSPSAEGDDSAVFRWRLPWLRREVGLGEVIRSATLALRIPECRPCGRRAEKLSRLIAFTGGNSSDRPQATNRAEPKAVTALYRAVERARRSGLLHYGHMGIIGEVAWLYVQLGELAALEDHAVGVLLGNPDSAEQLQALLVDAPHWEFAEPGPESIPSPVACAVQPVSPLVLIAAGRVLDTVHGPDGHAHWTERAVGYAAARFARVQGVLSAAAVLGKRKQTIDEFARWFHDLRPDGGDPSHPPMHAGSNGELAGLPIPSVSRWDPCARSWAHCAQEVGAGSSSITVDQSIVLSGVAPASVCATTGGKVTLSPRRAFPDPPDPDRAGFLLNAGDQTYWLSASHWAHDHIDVVLPPGLPSGCADISWQGQDVLRTFQDAFPDCARRFPLNRPSTAEHAAKPVRLTVLADPTVTFRANGHSVLTAEAGTPITLTWDVDAGLCEAPQPIPGRYGHDSSRPADEHAPLHVNLAAGKKVIVADAGSSGQLTVDEPATTTYQLTARTMAGDTVCGTSIATVTVNRVATLSLSVAVDRVWREGEAVPLTVWLPVPAPAGGITVALESSDSAVISSTTAHMEAGARKATLVLPVVGESGLLTIVGSASGFVSASIQVPVHPSSCLPPSFNLPRERYGGSWARPVSIPGVVGVHMAVLHTGEVLLFNYDEGSGSQAPVAALLQCARMAASTWKACDDAWDAAVSSCEAARVARKANCDAGFPCATAADCNSFWSTDPRRYFCHAARLTCELLRGACRVTADALFGLCRAAAWVQSVACKAPAVAACTALGITTLWDILSSQDTALTIARSNRARCALWNPATNAVTIIPLARNLFCSGHAFLPDGRLFVAGGQFPAHLVDGSPVGSPSFGRGAAHDVHLFDPTVRRWMRLADMPEGRWYPTVVTLDDGRVAVMSGNGTFYAGANGIQDSLQVFNPLAATAPGNGGRATEPFRPAGPLEHFYHLYPFSHVLPSGRVFVHWKRKTAEFAAGTGTSSAWWWHWTGPLYGVKSWKQTMRPVSRTGSGPGTSVLLPLKPSLDQDGGTPRYPAGKIMIIGGGGSEGESDPEVPSEKPYLDNTTPATETSEILDFDHVDVWGIPDWRWTGKNQAKPSFMRHPRVMPDAVLLPDGTVLVVNGARRGRSGGFLIHFGAGWGAESSVLQPECFDPDSETWREFCAKPLERYYHVTAALLPDARVVVAGHDGFLNRPGQPSVYELEVFSPPYLHRGQRPVITFAPAAIGYGGSFTVDLSEITDVATAALVRQSSITHQTNTDQRYVGLSILSHVGTRLTLATPTSGGVAPPGYYMLFVLNRAGVPSVAHWVRVAATPVVITQPQTTA